MGTCTAAARNEARAESVRRKYVQEVAQVAQVTVRHSVIASGPCKLGDPGRRRPALSLRPLGYPTDRPTALSATLQ